MGRAATKDDLVSSANANYEELNRFISSMTGEELSTPFDFSADTKKKEAHWERDRTLRDVIIHLYEWHVLMLDWVSSNMEGDGKPFIPAPYNWKTYGDMNVEFWRKHQNTPLDDATKMLAASHRDVVALVEGFTNDELFSKNAFPWVGGSTLGSYFVSVTASHYDWGLKKLKAHRKNCRDTKS